MLRESVGGASHARAFVLGASGPAPGAGYDAEAKPKPRRRRAPRTFEGGEGAPSSESEEA
jgi:hypothetical protein